jgi:outer membrane autotransporter protein
MRPARLDGAARPQARTRVLVLLISLIGVAQPAAAECVNITTGVVIRGNKGQPLSNQSVVCDTVAPNPPPSSTLINAAGGSTGVSVTVLPGSVLAPNKTAITIVDDSTALNQGTISTTGNNDNAISTSGTGDTVTNEGTITTNGSNSQGIVAPGSNTTVINSGAISVTGGAVAIEVGSNRTVTNSGTASGATGVLLAGDDNQLNNSGTVAGTAGSAISVTGNNNVVTLAAGSVINGTSSSTGAGNQFVLTGLGTVSGNVTGFSTLTMSGPGVWSIGGSVDTSAGTPSATNIVAGNLIITGSLTNTNGGGVTIANGAVLTIGNGGSGGSVTGNIADDGTLVLDRSDPFAFADAISGSGGLVQSGTGLSTLSGGNSYSGATQVDAGTLQAGAPQAFSPASAYTVASGATLDLNNVNSTIGSLSGAGSVTLGSATLTEGADNTSTTFSGAISGAGGFIKAGTGTLTLAGTSSFSGPLTAVAGTLRVDGTLVSTPASVANGAVLEGTGTIGGPVTIANGGTIGPGDAPGTLTTGPLTLNSSSIVNYELGTANVVGANVNDLINVNGNLTLAGLLNVVDTGGFGAGSYRLINYTGALIDNHLAIRALATGLPGEIQTSVPGQVNLVVGTDQFWDGTTISGDGIIHGGSGTWDNTTTNWTSAGGTSNSVWQSNFGVFAASAGTVTAAVPVSFQGLEFQTGGYVVAATGGGALAPSGNATILVEFGQATISAPITGAGSLIKADNGTLVLTGNNTFSGGVALDEGTLLIGTNNALGTGALAMSDVTTLGVVANNLSLANAVTLSGANTIDVGTDTLTLSGAVADGANAGALIKAGTGTLFLSGANTYSGGTMLSAGTLAVSNNTALGTGAVAMAASTTLAAAAGNLSLANAISLSGTGTIDTATNTLTLAGSIVDGTGPGNLAKIGTGTLVLTGVSTYSGGTTISAGTLAGAVSAFGTGAIADNAVLDIVQPADATFAAAINGTGSVTKDGAGALTLRGSSTYSGPTSVNAGALLVDGALGATTVNVANGAVLGGRGTIAGPVTVASGGTVAPGGASPGTLATGPLTLNSTSTLDYQLGTANVVGGATSDLLNVNGPFALAGTLNVTSGLDFGPGSYRLINYTGALTDNGLAIGAIPGGLTALVQTAIPGAVNLIVIGPGGTDQFWDGAAIKGDGTIHGGSGTWDNSTTNWTNVNGTINAAWLSSFGIFAGTAGTVTVAEPISFQGLEFQTDGYVVTATGTGVLTPVGATILVTPGAVATIAAPIVGADGIVKADGGTLALTGDNSFAGGVMLIDGTLQVGSNTALGTGTLAMSDETTLGAIANNLSLANAVTLSGTNTIDTGSNTLTLSNALVDGASAGGLIKAGTGTLILSGTNTYSGGTTISAGTLQGAVAAFGSGAILDNGTLVINQPTDATFANTIGGTGALTKDGAGTLTLTGANSYTGPTTILAGAVIVNGSIAFSPVTVQSGATLGNAGTVGSLTVLDGATVAPASSAGTQISPASTHFATLNVNGNVTFAPGSTLVVNINSAGQNDRVTATGTATIQGGAVQIFAAPGDYLPTIRYTLVSAAGGLTGNFSSLTTNTDFAFLTPVLSSDANDIFLTFEEELVTPPGGGPPELDFASVAITPNQMAVANAVQALGLGNPLFDVMLEQDPMSARDAFDKLSGEVYASSVAAIVSDSRLPREAILDRLNAACEAAEWKAGATAPEPRNSLCDKEELHVWAQGFGNWGATSGSLNVAATSRVTAGLIAGVDTMIDVWDHPARLGFASGYFHDALDDPRRTSSAEIQNGFLSLYGGADFAFVDARGGVIYTFDQTHADREIVFPGLSTATSAALSGHSTQEFLDLSHAWPVAALEPFAEVSALQSTQDAFSESNSVAALEGAENTHDYVSTIVGLRAKGSISDDVPIVARLTLGWQHEFGNTDPQASLTFAGSGNFFDIIGAPLNRDALATHFGFDYAILPAVRIGLSYLGEYGGSANDNAVRGEVNVSW